MAQVWRMTPGHLCKYRYGVLFFTSCYRGWGHCLQGVGYLKVCDNGTAKKSVYDFNVIFPLMSSNKVKSKTHPKPSQSHTHTHTQSAFPGRITTRANQRAWACLLLAIPVSCKQLFHCLWSASSSTAGASHALKKAPQTRREAEAPVATAILLQPSSPLQ
jgi:hypothetical protein